MRKHEFDESVHYSIKGRKRYKRKLLLVFVIMTLILLVCAVMFYFGNVTWDPNQDFQPIAQIEYAYQMVLIVLGAVLAAVACVGTFFYCWFDIGKFYKSQAAYFKTKKFKENKAKALDRDLVKLDKKTLKWYKKLGYLNGDEFREVIEKQKTKDLKEKKDN